MKSVNVFSRVGVFLRIRRWPWYVSVALHFDLANL